MSNKLSPWSWPFGSPRTSKPPTQPDPPITPTIPISTIKPQDILTVGDYAVLVEKPLSGVKLADYSVESYQVQAWRPHEKNGYRDRKTCTLRKIPSAFTALKKACEDEMHIMLALAESRHSKVFPLLDGSWEESHVPSNPPLWDVFYLFSDLEVENLSGILADHRENDRMIAEEDIIRIAIDLVDALVFLHASKPPLLHRNIRPSSVIKTSSGIFKFSSFLSAAFAEGSQSSADQLVADIECYTDPRYRPPEMTGLDKCSDKSTVGCTAESDVWCIGILLYIMCYRVHPFALDGGGNIQQARLPKHDWRKYRRIEYFLDLIFKQDPKSRPTAEELRDSLRDGLPIEPPVLGPCLVFSPEIRKLLAIPRSPYKSTDRIEKGSLFLDPSKILSGSFPQRRRSTKELTRKVSTSSQVRVPTRDQARGGTSRLGGHVSSLSPGSLLHPGHNRSKSASPGPSHTATGLNRADGKDGLAIPSILIHTFDGTSSSGEIPPSKESASLVPASCPVGTDYLSPPQSAQVCFSHSQSSRKTYRSQSAGDLPRPTAIFVNDDEFQTSVGDMVDDHSAVFGSNDSCKSTPRWEQQRVISPSTPGSSNFPEDAGSLTGPNDLRDHSPKGLLLEIPPMREEELGSHRRTHEADGSQEAEASSPDHDIGHLITSVSLEAVCVSGGFSDLYEGTHLTMGRVALKRPRIVGTPSTEAAAAEKDTIRRFEREGLAWRSLDHPHILKFMGTFKRERYIYFVSPFINNGSLPGYVNCHPSVNRVRLLCETADAINYLHERDIVHGDIKASNILISDNEHALLCDFGLTKDAHSKTSTGNKGVGTTRWQSPELFDGESKTFQSDAYAFAMTIVEVITGRPPFSNLPDSAIIVAVWQKDQRPAKAPTESGHGVSYETAWMVAEACWSKQPAERMTILEAFRTLKEDPSLAPNHIPPLDLGPAFKTSTIPPLRLSWGDIGSAF